MNLIVWQKRLEQHFAALRNQFATKVDRPLFALEHGLSESEIRELRIEICTHIRREKIFAEHWLAWIVYASEMGYLYEGEEYWQTFAKLTPNWIVNGDRNTIRRFFVHFHKHFNGAIPTGDWARQFSIICWPITHAILPQDLQFHLAKILYEIRNRFNSDFLSSPKLLGEQIAAHSFNTSSRFINFAQEHFLVGQIAAALLFKEEQLQTQLILPKTLHRIATDLDKERRSREWIRDARKQAHKVELKGLQKGNQSTPKRRTAEAESLKEEIESLAIEPNLILRPTSGAWDIIIEIPDLTPLLSRFPSLAPVLNSRCRIAGSATRSPRPLRGIQRVVLMKWPTSDTVLLQFEIPSPELSFLFSSECLLRPGPYWLFKIFSDGFAYEMRSKTVRAGQKYILLTLDDPQESNKLDPISINCSGIKGSLFELPEFISQDWQRFLNSLELVQARSLSIWPAGLPAAAWDGEGRVEWITNDTPCLGIRADHELSEVTLDLNGGSEFRLNPRSKNFSSTEYIELSQLKTGLNVLGFRVTSVPPNQYVHFGRLEILIREPERWLPGQSSRNPLQFILDPQLPTLEQLWEGKVSLDIIGPNGYELISKISLSEKSSKKPLLSKTLPSIKLPFTNNAFNEYAQAHIQIDKAIQNIYDFATHCELKIDGKELGRFIINCDRAIVPLRWIIRTVGNNYILNLIDDTGHSSRINIFHYDFDKPDLVKLLDEFPLESSKIPEAGGLYIAAVGDTKSVIVVPPRLHKLGDFKFNPVLRAYSRSVQSLKELIDLYGLWGTARLPGNIAAATRRRSVLGTILRSIYSIICGSRWGRAEEKFYSFQDPDVARIWRESSDTTKSELNLGKDLIDIAAIPQRTPAERRNDLASIIEKYHLIPIPQRTVVKTAPGVIRKEKASLGPASSKWIAEFALRLATAPETLLMWGGEEFGEGITRLLNRPILAKVARYLVLVMWKNQPAIPLTGGPLYRGWEWN